jgi:hypothetical protein
VLVGLLISLISLFSPAPIESNNQSLCGGLVAALLTSSSFYAALKIFMQLLDGWF